MSLVPSNKEKLRIEWEKITSLKGKKRWEHIWEYYKILIIGIAIVLLLAGNMIYSAVFNPSPTIVLNVAWTYGPQLPEFFDELAIELNASLTTPTLNEQVDVFQSFMTGDPQIDMAFQSRFAAMIAIADLDIIIGNAEEIKHFASETMLLEISSWLPQGFDNTINYRGDNGESGVFGISLSDSNVLKNASFIYLEELGTPYLAVLTNTNRLDKVKQAIEVLLN